MNQKAQTLVHYFEARAATMIDMLDALRRDGNSDACCEVCKSVISEMERVRTTRPAPEVLNVIENLLVNLHDFLDAHDLPTPTHIVSQSVN